MIPLIIGAITTIVVLSVVSYILYYKFDKIDSTMTSASIGDAKIFQEMRKTDAELKLTDAELRLTDAELKNVDIRLMKADADFLTTLNKTSAMVKSEDDLLRNSITANNKTFTDSLTSTNKLMTDNVTKLQGVDKTLTDNVTKLQGVDKTFETNLNNYWNTVKSEYKYTTGEFTGVKGEYKTLANTVNTNLQTHKTDFAGMTTNFTGLSNLVKTNLQTHVNDMTGVNTRFTGLSNVVGVNKAYTDSEFKRINTTFDENKLRFKTGALTASTGVMQESVWAPWSSFGNTYANNAYNANIGTNSISVFKNVWDSSAPRVFNVDSNGNTWQAGTMKAKTADIEDGTLRVFKNKDPNLGVNIFSTGQTGDRMNLYNGGLESTGTIGFRNTSKPSASFIHNTSNGATEILGNLTNWGNTYTGKGFTVLNMNDNTPFLESAPGASPVNRIGIGRYSGGIKMYGPDISSVGLAKINNNNQMQDMLNINSSNEVDIMTNMNVKGNMINANNIKLTGRLDINGPFSTVSNVNITTGSLGIGTSNPSNKLHVIGGTLFSGATSTFQHNMVASSNAELSFDGATPGSRFVVKNQTSGGNVGIGTATPTSKLHVVGGAYVAGGQMKVDSDIVVNQANQLSLDGVSTGSRFVVKPQASGGYVGIGTATPTAPLHVSGNGIFSGTLNSGALSVTGNGLFTGSVTTGALTSSAIKSTGTGVFTGSVTGGSLCVGTTCINEAALKKINALP